MMNRDDVSHTCRRINEKISDGTASADDVTRKREGHVTGSGRATWSGCALCCWCVLLMTLAVIPATSAVERWNWYSPARLDVKVYPRYSVLAAAQSVTVQCSVRSVMHVHRSRLRVGFYFEVAEDTALPLSIEVPGIDIWAEPKSFHVRTAQRGRRGWFRQPDIRYLTVGKQAYRFLRHGDNHFFCAALEWRSGARGVGYFTVRKV